jgi:hypothetical protein
VGLPHIGCRTQNIENNPMQSSLAVADMRDHEDILTRRANHLQYSIIAQIRETQTNLAPASG